MSHNASGNGISTRSLKKTRIYGPDVHVLVLSDSVVVEKTYRDKILPVRILGSLLVCWEAYIYVKLSGIQGIPACTISPDRYTITTSFMGGQNLKEIRDAVDGAYFDALKNLIRSIHRRSVVHLDLRNRRNYGIDDAGAPYLLDFASSIYIPRPRIIMKLLCAIDWMGFLKVKERLRPDLISADERRWLGIGNTLSMLWFPPRIVRMIRTLGKSILRGH
ncbi:MAG: hypothetical protein ACP5G0_14580 [Desulfomonilia bacterium]